MKKIIFYLPALILIISCKDSSNLKVGPETLLDKSIDAHGGWDKWTSLDSIHYEKVTILYDEEGAIEKHTTQQHTYYNYPATSGEYSWQDSIEHTVYFEDGKSYRKDGDQAKVEDSSVMGSFQAAYYVLNMPWKLKDEGAKITDLGLEKLFDGREVRTLQVIYPNETKKDPWWYYFDPVTFRLVGNKVHHGTYYALILNEEYATYKSLLWNKKRSSYRVDNSGKVQYKRGEFIYNF